MKVGSRWGRKVSGGEGGPRAMQRSRQNSNSIPLRVTGRWCTTPCSRFSAAECEQKLDGTLADRIAGSRKALTAYELAELLAVSAISIFRLAKRGVIPAFRSGLRCDFVRRLSRSGCANAEANERLCSAPVCSSRECLFEVSFRDKRGHTPSSPLSWRDQLQRLIDECLQLA